MENSKCCYCRGNVTNGMGFIGIISYHDECFKKKFIKNVSFGYCEHIVFD